MGTGSLPGVKRSGRGVDHSPLCRGEIKERVKLYLYSLSGPLWPLPFTYRTVHPWEFCWTFTTYSVFRVGCYKVKAANLYSCVTGSDLSQVREGSDNVCSGFWDPWIRRNRCSISRTSTEKRQGMFEDKKHTYVLFVDLTFACFFASYSYTANDRKAGTQTQGGFLRLVPCGVYKSFYIPTRTIYIYIYIYI